jgi:hypothetical protein
MQKWLWLGVLLAACSGNGSNATEMSCNDGEDDDGDGVSDCDDSDCTDDPACEVPVGEICDDGVDNDASGLTDCEDPSCFEDPVCYDFDDEVDLPAPNGDPSVDIDKASASLANGTATFFVTTEGSWPPPGGTYSWFILFEVDNDGNTPVAAYTIQQHDGVDETIPYGVPAANITARETPAGVWVRITGVPVTGEKFYIESGIQKLNPGTRVTDTVVGAPAPFPP